MRAESGIDDTVLAALMNSSWFQLCLELVARVNFGDGVLWLGLTDARESLMLPDPRELNESQRDALRLIRY